MSEYNSVMFNNASDGFLAVVGGIWILGLALCVCMTAVFWKLFKKAGEPGWASLVPFYRAYVLCKIAFGNCWIFYFLFFPILNVVAAVILPFQLAKAFGKDVCWGFGLLFLGIVFYPILAFGNAKYIGVAK